MPFIERTEGDPGTDGGRRALRRGRSVAVLVWGAVVLLELPALGAPQSFSGALSPDDSGTYLDQEFLVPEGTVAVHATYSFATEGIQNPLISNAVDLGIYDPEGFRGWSGTSKTDVTVALGADQTTNGYVAGPIPAGTWHVEIGAGFISPGSSVTWELTVDTELGSGAPFVPPDWTASNLAGPGWYRGDLHCHSSYSDGSYSVDDVVSYAHGRGLDFLAVTDHQTFTQHHRLLQLQSQYADLLLLRGMEWTSYHGHANIFGLTRYEDYHVGAPGFAIQPIVDQVHQDGAMFSVNHPDLPGITISPNVSVSLGWTVPDTDWSTVDSLEVVNGPSALEGFVSNPLNDAAIARWDDLLLEGLRITAVGGSDDHRAGQGSGVTNAPIGMPTTVVYAEELSEAGIMAGIRSGRVYLMADGPDGPELDLAARCGEQEATMGAEAAGTLCTLTASVHGAFGNNLKIIVDKTTVEQIFITSNDFSHEVEVVPAALSAARIEVRSPLGPLRGLTNPVFLRYDDTPDPADGGTDAGEDAGPFDAGPDPPDGGEGGGSGGGPSLLPPAMAEPEGLAGTGRAASQTTTFSAVGASKGPSSPAVRARRSAGTRDS